MKAHIGNFTRSHFQWQFTIISINLLTAWKCKTHLQIKKKCICISYLRVFARSINTTQQQSACKYTGGNSLYTGQIDGISSCRRTNWYLLHRWDKIAAGPVANSKQPILLCVKRCKYPFCFYFFFSLHREKLLFILIPLHSIPLRLQSAFSNGQHKLPAPHGHNT